MSIVCDVHAVSMYSSPQAGMWVFLSALFFFTSRLSNPLPSFNCHLYVDSPQAYTFLQKLLAPDRRPKILFSICTWMLPSSQT